MPAGILRAMNPNLSSGPPNRSANDIFADLTRAQWASYQYHTVPYQNKLIEFATSRTAADEAMERAGGTVNSAFDRQGGLTQERLQGLGLSLNADEQRVATRTGSLSRSLADVQARNQAGRQTRSLQQSLLGNPTPDVQALTRGLT